MLNRSSDSQFPLIGSMHKYSDGYGYGQRYPTSRNEPTFPSSVPFIRYEPFTERYLKNTTSCAQIHNDIIAEKRNADQILFTTSGEIGKFYVDSESKAVKLSKTNNKFKKTTETSNIFTENTKIKDLSNIKLGNLSNSLLTERSIGSALIVERQKSFIGESPHLSLTSYPSLEHRRSNNNNKNTFSTTIHINTSRTTNTTTNVLTLNNIIPSTSFLSTIKELDKSFPKVNRRDLFAATLPMRSEQEQRWTVANNDRCTQSSKFWIGKLRKDISTT